jgi:hypothetical protein
MNGDLVVRKMHGHSSEAAMPLEYINERTLINIFEEQTSLSGRIILPSVGLGQASYRMPSFHWI